MPSVMSALSICFLSHQDLVSINRIRPSSEPKASAVPSGLNAAESTPEPMINKRSW